MRPKNSLIELEGYSKSKLLLDELYIIFNICKPECSICDKYILQLSRHVQNKHRRAQDENENGHSESDSETIVPDQVPIKKPHTQLRTYRSASRRRLRTVQRVNYAELLGNNDTDIKIHTYDDNIPQAEESQTGNPTDIIAAHVGEPESDPLGDCSSLDPDFDVNLDIDIDCVVKVEEEVKVDLGYDYNVGATCEIPSPSDSEPNSECQTESETISTVSPNKHVSASKKPTTNAKVKAKDCNICDKKLIGRDLSRHLMFGHGALPVENSTIPLPVNNQVCTCSICRRRFSEMKYLANHLRNKHKKFSSDGSCNLCGKKYTGRQLNRHLNGGHRPDSNPALPLQPNIKVCNVCQRRFTGLKYLNYHLRKVHKFAIPVIGKTYACDICKENFNSKPLLCTHVLTHGERPYICQTCNKNFGTRDNLKEHEKSHSGEYKVQCEVCNKWIGRRKRLKVHMLTHSDFKKIICEICGKGFNIKAQLQQHMLTHTGEKPYECEICKKAFSLKLSLRDHIKVHTGERSFVCDTCGKSYKWRKQLVIHMRSHTGEKPYVCKFCSKGFTSRPAQTDHMKRHHDYVEPATS